MNTFCGINVSLQTKIMNFMCFQVKGNVTLAHNWVLLATGNGIQVLVKRLFMEITLLFGDRQAGSGKQTQQTWQSIHSWQARGRQRNQKKPAIIATLRTLHNLAKNL